MDPQMKRGFVEACVLASVCGGESYGYEIIRNVPQALGLTESTLYPVLKRLERAGQVSVRSSEHNGRLRKYYLATEAGREALEPPAEAAARIISEMPAVPRAAARLRSPKTPRSWFVAFIVAAVIGSPVWIPLTLGVIMAVIGCFIGLFGLLVAVWAIAASMLLGAPIGLLYLVAGVKAGSVAGALMGLGCGVAVAGVGVFGIHLAVAASKLLVRAIVWCARAVASPFVRSEVPRWEWGSMHPTWNLVHLVAAVMIGAGLVLGLAGWSCTGFDSASASFEMARTTASANEFTNPLGLQLFYAGAEPDNLRS